MEKIICPKCGTENKSDYNFCVGCGETLVKQEPKHQEPCSANASSDNTYEPSEEQVNGGSIGNMPIGAAVDFIGGKANHFIPKFTKFDASGSTASWNWPVALFSFLLGMPFIWFFYRKMYKIGWILFGICSFLFVVETVCALQVVNSVLDLLSPYLMHIVTSESGTLSPELQQQLSLEMVSLTSQLSMPSLISNLSNIALFGLNIYISIVANGLYMKHMLKVFNKSAANNPQGVSPYELRSLGGTSSGIAVGIAFLFVGFTFVFSMATVGASLIDFYADIIKAVMILPY